MTFGEKLVYYRGKKRMTQKALAEALGITPTRLNYWEKNKREPDVEMIRLLAEVLDVSANVLVGYRETQPPPELESVADVCTTSGERELLSLYNQMNDAGQNLLLNTARTFAGNPAMRKDAQIAEAV